MAAPQTPGTPAPPPAPAAIDATPGAVAPVPAQPPVTYQEGSTAFLRGPQGIVQVPAELAERYIAEQGYLPASPEHVAERREQKQYEGLAGGTVAAAERIGMGLTDALTAIPRGAAALGYAATGSEALKDFVESTATDRFFRDVAWLQGGAEAEQAFERGQRAQAAAWPTLTQLSRGIGQGIGALASAGTAGVAGAAGQGLGGRAAAYGAAGAAEGLAFGATSPFDNLDALPNTAATREAVLANGFLGAILGGAAAGAGPLLGRAAGRIAEVTSEQSARLRSVFGRGGKAAADEAAGKASVSAVESPAVRAAQAWDDLAGDVARAADQAGPNPKAMQRAADDAAAKAARELEEQAGRVTPENWDKVELSEVGKWHHRDVLVEGATRSVARDLDDVLRITREATQSLREAPLKRELVAKNLAESGIDETVAIGSAQQRIAQTMSNTADLAARGADFKESARTLKSITSTLQKASQALDTVDNAADAYIAVDQARRELYKLVPGLANQARNPMAHIADQGRSLLEFVEGEYRALADSLFDESVWGRQGAAQSAVNHSWVGAIDADKVGMRNFTGVGSYDIYNRPQFIADPDKIRSYLDRLGSTSLRDQEFRRIIETQEKLARAMKDAYELSPTTQKQLDRAIEATSRMRETLGKAEEVVAAANSVRRTMSAEQAQAMGRLGNIAIGLSSDGIRGALAGALFPGGRAGALQTMASLRDLAEANRGQLAEAMAKAVESAMGAAPKSKAAARKAAESTRATGLLSPAGERTQKRVQRALLASAPAAQKLLSSTRDLPRTEQHERYRERREALAQLITNPAVMQRELARTMAPIVEAHPALGTSLMIDVAQKLNRLLDAMPGRKNPSLIPARVRDVVSDAELRTAEAFVEATVDPMSVFRDFQRGQLDYEKLRFAREQWPEMFAQAKAALVDIAMRLEDDAPDTALAQLDQMMGLGGALEPTLKPDFLARSMERGEMFRAEMEQQEGPNPSVTAARTAVRHQTFVNRLMGGGAPQS